MKQSTRYKNNLNELKQRLEAASGETPNFNIEKFTNEARKQIANKFVNLYFILLVLSFVIPAVYNVIMYSFTGNDTLFIPLKDVVLLTSSTLGGSLGFIVGFYFKDK